MRASIGTSMWSHSISSRFVKKEVSSFLKVRPVDWKDRRIRYRLDFDGPNFHLLNPLISLLLKQWTTTARTRHIVTIRNDPMIMVSSTALSLTWWVTSQLVVKMFPKQYQLASDFQICFIETYQNWIVQLQLKLSKRELILLTWFLFSIWFNYFTFALG